MTRILLYDIRKDKVEIVKDIVRGHFSETEFIEVFSSELDVMGTMDQMKAVDLILADISLSEPVGLQFIRTIKNKNFQVQCVLASKCMEFDMVYEAMQIGALDYILKPVQPEKLDKAVEVAQKVIDREKAASIGKEIEEKMKIILPVIENGFINNILIKDEEEFQWDIYKNLFGIDEEYGYMLAIECGDKIQGGKLTNPIGAGVHIQRHMDILQRIIRKYFRGIYGGPLSNRIFICVLFPEEEMGIQAMQQTVENTKKMAEEIELESRLQVKIGIGNVKPMKLIQISCRQALQALKQPYRKIVHISEIGGHCGYEEDYPLEIEEEIFMAVRKGNVRAVKAQSREFFNWMVNREGELDDNIRLKCLEFVLRGETIGYFQGGLTYYFDCRESYLHEVLACRNVQEMENWFLEKMAEAGINMGNVVNKEVKDYQGIVVEAQHYVEQNYRKEITLNRMSDVLHVHPNYFSRVFKEKTGMSFVDYVSHVRVKHAENLLRTDNKRSVKEISIECGYKDSNYFGRVFKRHTGMSPADFRRKQIRTVYPDG